MAKMEDNVNLMAKHYVETLNRPPNAWGQHLSHLYGQSHFILIRMTQLFGERVTNLAVDRAMNPYKNNGQ